MPRCESKQDRSRSLVLWQHAFEDHWLIYETAASEVADRHNQRRAKVAVAKLKLAHIRPSAAVFSFWMCPEPAPIKPGDLVEWARQVCPSPSKKSVASIVLPATLSQDD